MRKDDFSSAVKKLSELGLIRIEVNGIDDDNKIQITHDCSALIQEYIRQSKEKQIKRKIIESIILTISETAKVEKVRTSKKFIQNGTLIIENILKSSFPSKLREQVWGNNGEKS